MVAYKCPLFLISFIVTCFIILAFAPEVASQPTFEDLLRKWEKRTEVGNFLIGSARLSYAELVQAHPRYTEQTRANMLAVVKTRTVIFLWLKNTGTENIRLSFSRMVLVSETGEKILPINYYALDNQPLEAEFILSSGQERTITLHYPKLPDLLKQAKLILQKCKYGFVNFDVQFNWNLAPPDKVNQISQKKAQLEKLQTDLQQRQKEQKQIEEQILSLQKEIADLEAQNASP